MNKDTSHCQSYYQLTSECRWLTESVHINSTYILYSAKWLCYAGTLLFQNLNKWQQVITRDVMKLVNIRIRRMQILTFTIRWMWMRIVAFILVGSQNLV